jgi:hypothetical protein
LQHQCRNPRNCGLIGRLLGLTRNNFIDEAFVMRICPGRPASRFSKRFRLNVFKRAADGSDRRSHGRYDHVSLIFSFTSLVKQIIFFNWSHNNPSPANLQN